MKQQCSWVANSPYLLGSTRKLQPVSPGRDPALLSGTCKMHLEGCCILGLLHMGRTQMHFSSLMEDTEVVGGWSTGCLRRGCGSWICSPGSRQLQGGLNNSSRYPAGRRRQERASFLSMYSYIEGWTLLLEHGEFWLKLKQVYFTVEVTKHGKRCPEKLCDRCSWRWSELRWTQP